MTTPDKPHHGYTRHGDLYLPDGITSAVELRSELSASRDLIAVEREHQWVSLADNARHAIRMADVAEVTDRAKRSRRQRAKDAREAAKLADLYRSAKSAGARARVRAEMYASAEMRALRIDRMRKVTLVGGIPVLLAFAAWSTTGVQAGVVKLLNLPGGSPAWWTAWGVEPALIALVAFIIIGRAMLRTSGGDVDWRATAAEWTALGSSLALNIFGGWSGGWGALGGAVAHSLGPLGAAGTAFLIGLFDAYLAQAKPWDGAQRLAELGFDATAQTVTDEPAQELELPPVAQLDLAPVGAQTERVDPPVAQPEAAAKPRTKTPPAPRKKAAQTASTSSYAPGEDPGTLAAQYAIANSVSNRQAAEKFGVSEGTVRNRRREIEAAKAADKPAQAAVPMTPIRAPEPAVTHGVNGNTPTLTEETL